MFNSISFAAFVFFSILCSAPLTAQDDWAATPSDVQSSPCRRFNIASPKIIESFLDNTLSPALPPETRTFFGLKLTGDPRILSAIQDLLRNEREIFGKWKNIKVKTWAEFDKFAYELFERLEKNRIESIEVLKRKLERVQAKIKYLEDLKAYE
jgi:hypothetical protein